MRKFTSKQIKKFIGTPLFSGSHITGRTINRPKISIITPSYNQSRFLEKTILSVLNQLYDNLEYIIIDGASTDNSVKIIEKYSDYLSYWESKPDRGQTHAINKGLSRSTGDILAYINSDDIYLPGTFDIIAKYYMEHAECKISTGNDYLINEKDNIIYYCKNRYYKRNELEIGVNRIRQHTVFWRREVQEKIGLFNEDLNWSMDFDYWIRSSKFFRFYHFNLPIACYRHHTQTKSDNKVRIDGRMEKKKCLESAGFIQPKRMIFKRLLLTAKLRIMNWISIIRSGYIFVHLTDKLKKIFAIGLFI